MANVANYPGKPFDSAMKIAETVDKLGSKTTIHTLADKLGVKSEGGSFADDVNTSVKHGLIEKNKTALKTTQLFSDIKLAYSEEEKQQHLKKAFLTPDTYREILTSFDGKELPIDVLDKILIREYDVKEGRSQRVANNIIKGGEKVKIIVNGIVHLNLEGIVFDEPKEKIQQEKKANLPKLEKIVKEATASETLQKGSVSTAKLNMTNLHKDVNININIQLSVPETTNEEVYEKFFAAMKKHLLS